MPESPKWGACGKWAMLAVWEVGKAIPARGNSSCGVRTWGLRFLLVYVFFLSTAPGYEINRPETDATSLHSAGDPGEIF